MKTTLILIAVFLLISFNVNCQYSQTLKGIGVAKWIGNEGNIVKIENFDNSTWLQFSFNSSTDSDYKVLNKKMVNIGFKPYAMHLDYNLLLAICRDSIQNRYEIEVSDTGSSKYVKCHDWQFYSWKNLILSTFSIDFNHVKNLIKSDPSEHSRTIIDSYDPHDVRFQALEISGDWLKIRWEYLSEIKTGWIRWKINDKLIIELQFIC